MEIDTYGLALENLTSVLCTCWTATDWGIVSIFSLCSKIGKSSLWKPWHTWVFFLIFRSGDKCGIGTVNLKTWTEKLSMTSLYYYCKYHITVKYVQPKLFFIISWFLSKPKISGFYCFCGNYAIKIHMIKFFFIKPCSNETQ